MGEALWCGRSPPPPLSTQSVVGTFPLLKRGWPVAAVDRCKEGDWFNRYQLRGQKNPPFTPAPSGEQWYTFPGNPSSLVTYKLTKWVSVTGSMSIVRCGLQPAPLHPAC